MKLQACAVGIARFFLAQSAVAQVNFLSNEELIKEFDRDVVFETASKTRITHKKGGSIESNSQDSRGRPAYDSGKYAFKDGKYCTQWFKSRANEESCFLIFRRDSDIVFHALDGRELSTRRELR